LVSVLARLLPAEVLGLTPTGRLKHWQLRLKHRQLLRAISETKTQTPNAVPPFALPAPIAGPQ
jgi:hypothetical protein